MVGGTPRSTSIGATCLQRIREPTAMSRTVILVLSVCIAALIALFAFGCFWQCAATAASRSSMSSRPLRERLIHPATRFDAMRELEFRPADEVVALTADDNASLRSAAIRVIARWKRIEYKDILWDFALNDPDRYTRFGAIFGIGYIGDSSDIPRLDSLLRDPDDGIVSQTRESIMRIERRIEKAAFESSNQQRSSGQ